MRSGVSAGGLAPLKHLVVPALMAYSERHPVVAEPDGHAPLLEDAAQHLPHALAFIPAPARAPAVPLPEAHVFVPAVPDCPAPREVAAGAPAPVTLPDGLAAAAPPLLSLVFVSVTPVVPALGRPALAAAVLPALPPAPQLLC